MMTIGLRLKWTVALSSGGESEKPSMFPRWRTGNADFANLLMSALKLKMKPILNQVYLILNKSMLFILLVALIGNSFL